MRGVLFSLGCVVLVGLWFGGLAELARHTFYGHMIVHMGVVAVASPLLALGMAGGRFDPVRKMPRLFAPIPASMVEFVFVWAWHAPLLHHMARHSMSGHLAEQGTFLFSGLFLWLSIVGGEPFHRDRRAAAGVIGLLLTAMHMTLLGALIGLAPRALYSHSSAGALTPLQDQHLGGAIMIILGGVTYLAGGLWLMSGLLRRRILRPGEQA